MRRKELVSLLKETYKKWSDHNASRLGASVAFYTLLSLAPLLVLTVAISSLVFNQQQAQNALINQARQMMGSRGAETVQLLLQHKPAESSGIIASVIAFITLLFGASGVFNELRQALNVIWDAVPKNESGIMGMIKERLFAFAMVLAVGLLLLISLLLSTGVAFIGKFFNQVVPIPPFALEIINFVVSFVIISFLFALMFKYVPALHISWRNVRVGAIGSALLFTIGKVLLGLYLGKASVGSAYGAAGSLVVVVVWVYYSAQIFFFGAEFTRVYADAHSGASVSKAAREPAAAVAGTAERGDFVSSPRPVLAPVRPKSRTSLLIAGAVAFLLGRKSAKSKSGE